MNINIADIDVSRAYRLLTNLVVPRPIAWVTSVAPGGILNLAPFSFFNMIGSNPPIVVLGIADQSKGVAKHTTHNIAASKEFVVNLVTSELAEAMNITATEFPESQSELPPAGLHPASSQLVRTPRVAEAKASLECTLHSIQRIGENNVIIGQIVSIHIADQIIDEELHVTKKYQPLGRMGSPASYCTTEDRFEMPRLSFAQWQAMQKT